MAHHRFDSCHMVAIYHAYYNFCRVHQTLRVTPAMEAGLSESAWTLEDIITMADTYLPQSAKRGPYRKKSAA